MTLELNLLKKEMVEESQNEMKKISKNWRDIKANLNNYKSYGLTNQESFYCALIDCGYLSLRDLR